MFFRDRALFMADTVLALLLFIVIYPYSSLFQGLEGMEAKERLHVFFFERLKLSIV
jgi:hypothetical protein